MSLSIWVVTHDQSTATSLVSGARGLGGFVGAVSLNGEAVPGADLTLIAAAAPPGQLIEGYAQPLAQLLVEKAAQVVLFGQDTQSRLLAGLVAAQLKTSVRNATALTVQVETVCLDRTIYGGLAVASEEMTGVGVIVVGPGALPAYDGPLAMGEVQAWQASPVAAGLSVREIQPKQAQTVNLATAKKVVGVGRGFAAEADLQLARDLATKLGAEIACSRPIAEGVAWLPVERYLGVSGATIKPELYVAIGISGQVQHMVGVNRAKTIIAINKDKNAPIFNHADYGVVGDLYTVLPALIAAV